MSDIRSFEQDEKQPVRVTECSQQALPTFEQEPRRLSADKSNLELGDTAGGEKDNFDVSTDPVGPRQPQGRRSARSWIDHRVPLLPADLYALIIHSRYQGNSHGHDLAAA